MVGALPFAPPGSACCFGDDGLTRRFRLSCRGAAPPGEGRGAAHRRPQPARQGVVQGRSRPRAARLHALGQLGVSQVLATRRRATFAVHVTTSRRRGGDSPPLRGPASRGPRSSPSAEGTLRGDRPGPAQGGALRFGAQPGRVLNGFGTLEPVREPCGHAMRPCLAAGVCAVVWPGRPQGS